MAVNSPTGNDDTTWEFRTYSIDAPSSAFGGFASFIDLWRSKFGESGCPPAWRDFELLDFEPWWGRLSLGEIDGDTGDITFVLWGTLLTDWWEYDYTKKSLKAESILREPAYSRQLAYYKALSSGERIGFNWGSFENTGRGFMRVRLVDLPLSVDEGMPARILSACEIFESEHVTPPSLAELSLG